MVKLNEAKQVGLLFHCTTLEGFADMADHDRIGKYPDSTVCFSRDRNYNHVIGSMIPQHVQLVLDGDRLSNKYKIIPYDDNFTSRRRSESEERVETQITPIGPYLLAVNLINNGDVKKYASAAEKDNIMEFFKKYPHIRNNLLPDLSRLIKLEKEITGFYDNGVKVKPFTLKSYPRISFNYLELSTVYDDEESECYYLMSACPSEFPYSLYLHGLDIVYVDSSGIWIRAQKQSQYRFLEKYNLPINRLPYESHLETEGQENEEEDYEYSFEIS